MWGLCSSNFIDGSSKPLSIILGIFFKDDYPWINECMKEIKVLVHKGQFVLKGILRTGNCEAGQVGKSRGKYTSFHPLMIQKECTVVQIEFLRYYFFIYCCLQGEKIEAL